jgi:hypothetical protein
MPLLHLTDNAVPDMVASVIFLEMVMIVVMMTAAVMTTVVVTMHAKPQPP